MPELALIHDLVLIWFAALLSGYTCVRLKQPVIVGYILAGIAIGPYGLRLIDDQQQVAVLAEFGVALLLFTLGVEVSLKQIFAGSKKVLLTGFAQIALTVAFAWLLAYLAGLIPTPATGFLFGCICALSSTVVVTKLLMERGELDSIHGRTLVAVLLLQDLSLVPVISLIPVLQQSDAFSVWPLLNSLLKAVVLLAVVVLTSTKIAPALLNRVVKSNYRELFFLTCISLCLGIALLSHQLGLSLALGAFLAGITLSTSTYGHQALADLLPMRDLFSTVFFVSVGMLLNPGFITQHSLEVFLFVLLLIIGKALLGALATLLSTPSKWSALLTGIGLAQIGEFSFVLALLGYKAGLVTEALYNLFFAGAVVSLVTSPFLIAAAPGLLRKLSSDPNKRNDRRTEDRPSPDSMPLRDHVILCGYGRIGRNLGMVLETHRLPLVVIELNAGILEDLEQRNIPYIYGDSVNNLVLLKANVRQATTLVITVPDPVAAVTITSIARHYNPNVKIIARAHRFEDIEIFRSAGVNAVVQPEFEASIETTRLTLLSLNRTDPEIQQALTGIRTRRYSIFQPDIAEADLQQLLGMWHDDQLGAWYKMDNPELNGKSIKSLDIRRLTGVTVVSIRHNQDTVVHPQPQQELFLDDELYLVGDGPQLKHFEQHFKLARFCPLTEITSDEISAAEE